jgi:hypothetical protein
MKLLMQSLIFARKDAKHNKNPPAVCPNEKSKRPDFIAWRTFILIAVLLDFTSNAKRCLSDLQTHLNLTLKFRQFHAALPR